MFTERSEAQNQPSPFRSQNEGSLFRKTEKKAPMCSYYATSGICVKQPRPACNRDTCTLMFTAVLFIMAKLQWELIHS